jgi:hypothetical protein
MFEVTYLFNERHHHPVKYQRMRRSFHAFFLGCTAASLIACASRWPEQRVVIMPGSITGDSALDGRYRWTSVDGKVAPAEFPVNSGRRLVYGTLDLRDAAAARAGSGSYSLRFTEQPANDTVRTTGSDGVFALRGDTVLLTPASSRESMRYRYAWRPSGDLELTDVAKHVWVYSRR